VSDPQRITFEVRSPDPGAELFLIDGNFRLLQRGIGRENFSVPPGLYKLKSRSGRASSERIVIVHEGMAPIDLEPIPLVSGMPFSGAPKTHEFHVAAAVRAGGQPEAVLGRGSNVVILARRWTAPQPSDATEPAPHPGRGLSLRDLNGTLLIDLETSSKPSPDFDPSVSLNVSLNPGAYLLALALPDGRTVQQTVVAAAGWQTHVYLLEDASVDRAAGVDIVNSAITYRKPGDSFDPDDQRLRNEEMARRALQDERGFLSKDMRQLIAAPETSPMLALLGAHLLVRDARRAAGREESNPQSLPQADQLTLDQVVANLRKALGIHPDVEAVAMLAAGSAPELPFDQPPMLRASWELLLEASLEHPQLIGPASLTATAAERIWGEGPWLLWLASAGDNVDRAALWQTRAKELIASLPPDFAAASDFRDVLLARLGAAVRFDAGKSFAPGSPRVGPLRLAWNTVAGVAAATLKRAKVLVTSRTRTPFPEFHASSVSAEVEPAFELPEAGVTLTEAQRKELVTRLGIPLSSLNAWIDQSRK
jgi:hypothetical protein